MDGLAAATPDSAPRADRKAPGKAPRKGARRPAETLKVARVAVDVSLAHLDRPFDYLVPADLDGAVVPGGRARVRFSGRLVDGLVPARLASSAHAGNLAFLAKVVPPEPVLCPEVAQLARAVA